MQYVEGNLLDYPIIAHQCNCTTTYGAGLYNTVIEKYPFADIYSSGIIREPGNIVVSSNIDNTNIADKNIISNIIVISMLAQVRPGKASRDDSKKMRLKYFSECLDKMAKLNLPEIAFPYLIGCGLAGGNWLEYEKLLCDFTRHTPIVVVKLKSRT